MDFKDRYEFNRYISKMYFIGEGSQGKCYLDNGLVYKIFYDYDSGYKEDDIIRFSDVINSTVIWPKDIIIVNNKIVGYISKYCNADNLYKIDPLGVNLDILESSIDKVYKDIDIITNKDVRMYDVRYNILYNNKFYIIDTLEYGNRFVDIIDNRDGFDKEIMLFLVDNYFNDFVSSNKILNEMYMEYGVSSLSFLKEFRNSLSEYLDRDIVYLRDAKKLVKRYDNSIYLRDIKR